MMMMARSYFRQGTDITITRSCLVLGGAVGKCDVVSSEASCCTGSSALWRMRRSEIQGQSVSKASRYSNGSRKR
jgi:hypothetical protein